MKKSDALFKVRLALLILLALSIFVSADFLQNYQQSLIPNDGIACSSVLHKFFLIFEHGSWSVRKFYDAFVNALWFTVIVTSLDKGTHEKITIKRSATFTHNAARKDEGRRFCVVGKGGNCVPAQAARYGGQKNQEKEARPKWKKRNRARLPRS